MKKYAPIILVLLAVAVFFGFIDPQYERVQTLRAEEGEYQSALEKAENVSQLQEELNAQYEAFSTDDLRKLSTILPQEVDRFRLLNDIDYLARRSGIALSSVGIAGERDQNANEVSSSEASRAHTSLTGSITFETTYENFKSFLRVLEKNLQVIDVTTIAISPGEGRDYSFNLGFSTYSLK